MTGIRNSAGPGWFAVLIALTASVAVAQDRRPMTPVDMVSVPYLSDPQISHDGSQLLYVLAEPDWEENKRIGHIWRVNADGTGTVRMTNGAEGEDSPRWSPDGTLIAFVATRGDTKGDEEDTSQVHLLRNGGGEARALTKHATSVSDIAWSPDGATVYFLAPEAKTEEEKAREKKKDDIFAYDENFQQQHLWRVSVADGAEERVTRGDYSILQYRLSRDGEMIALSKAPSPLFDNWDEGEVWKMSSGGEEAIQLTHNTVAEQGAELSPDGSTILFVSGSNNDFVTYHNENIFLVPAAGGEHRLLLPDMPYEVMWATWSTDGESIYFTANTGVRSELFMVDVATGALSQLTRGDHSIVSGSYLEGPDLHVLGISTPTNAGDLWLVSGTGGGPDRITTVYEYLETEFELPRQEAIQWRGADGVTVEGIVHYPLGYKEGTAYPLVVQTHGGPAASDKFGFAYWIDYAPVLTGMGYMVFQPNYRGSTGYGDDYLRDMVGHYYRQSHLDVMTGVDHLIEAGLADGDRMVKMGWSGGGHMTNKIITHTDRFKAASSGAGAVNWISMYGQSDVRTYRTPWFGGTPWQKNAPIDLYWEHSPLSDIWKVTTPTIVIVGAEDVRVPPPQSVELFRALRSNGVPTHLYMAPREPHVFKELRHALFKINVELEWFERHAMEREYTWEKAPGDKEEERD
jgi:dipeptidyl aminopeptidase/acylaminoacyl peptidase